MLTPVEIQGKTFKSGIGYEKRDVEAFFREVLSGYEFLYKENLELKDKVNTLNEGIQYYKKMENALQNALVLAEKTSEETRVVAQKHANTIEKEARIQAQEMVSNAKRELDRIYAQTTQLIQEYSRYKIQYKQLAATQLELLNSDNFNIETVQKEIVIPEVVSYSKKEERKNQEEINLPKMDFSSEVLSMEQEQIKKTEEVNEILKHTQDTVKKRKRSEKKENIPKQIIPFEREKEKEQEQEEIQEGAVKIKIPEDAPRTPVSDRTETLDEIIKSIQRSFAKQAIQPNNIKKKNDDEEFEFSDLDD